MALKRLGTLLVEEQLINEQQLAEALAAQKTSGAPLGEALVTLGHISEESLYRFLAIQHGLDYAELKLTEIEPALQKLVPAAVAWKYKAVPVAQENGSLTIATCQPDDLSLFYLPKDLRLPAESRLKIQVSPASQVNLLLEKFFPRATGRSEGSITAVGEAGIKQVEAGPTANPFEGLEEQLLNPDDINLELLTGEEKDEEEEKAEDEGPIIKLCEYILAEAVRRGTSDVHITPYERKITLKYRIDGSLIEMPSPPVNAKRRIATRFKIMSKTMNIIEKRLPQDGRIHVNMGSRSVDIRISTIPSRWGENIVMRIVDQSAGVKSLDDIGMEPDQLEHFKHAISQPYGMVFATGPTASGKTTTLFAALQHVNSPNRNILTVEDPVEYRLPHVIQIQVEPNAGRTFGAVLRAFLRHDPNIMLVGEIRDTDTASIAIKAALTGHLVLSSLHTNDAASSVMRLVDLGIEHVYVGSAVLCIASQRLIRKVCEKCKEKVEISPEELKRIGVSPDEASQYTFFKGKGCDVCNQTGYKGRIGLYEVMPISAPIREVIFKKGTLADIKAAAKAAGYKTIRETAVVKWKKGLTTIEEVLGETFE